MNSVKRRFGDLLSRFNDGSLDESEFAELATLLDQHESLRTDFVEYLDTVTLLNEVKGARTLSSPVLPNVQRRVMEDDSACDDATLMKTGERRRNALVFFSTAIAILLIANLAALLLLLRNDDHQFTVARLPGPPSSTVVSSSREPHLVAMTACLWQSDWSPKLRQSLRAGEVIELLAGIAEFEIVNDFGCTARVLVEGPASVLVQRNKGLMIQHGRVIANSGECSGEFEIGIPGGSVRFAESSSIGIDLSLSGSEIHSFEGEAQFFRIASETLGEHSILIGEGEAAKFVKALDQKLIVSRSQADDSLFASTRSMSLDQLRLPDSYAEAVLDSNPDIYWRFGSASSVTNSASTDRWNGIIEGNVVWKRYENNFTPEFGTSTEGPSMVVSNDLWPPVPLDEYSVELWAKPSHYHNATLVSLSAAKQVGTRHGHAFMLEVSAAYDKPDDIRQQNRLRFLQRNPPGSFGGTSCYSEEVYKLRAWQHVVARKSAGVMELFVNGKLSATAIHELPLVANLNIAVGQQHPRRRYVRSFIGQLDEVAFYPRALSDDEIQKHVEAATPQSADKRGIQTNTW
ncbi:LamG domain-containing protein [Rhodopirellula sallentina]|uniref:FecR protein n=1 Tax=Rhodopirellula sallentina SM41 TaxID=1263870 RepID=M5TS67_9BACT|nr:LamG domain-containing protein [Rhodopirellula sallentina]EMI52032.1 hypothetical protein RSSM_06520 [Rhodopirellula sallentina SM41]